MCFCGVRALLNIANTFALQRLIFSPSSKVVRNDTRSLNLVNFISLCNIRQT